MARDHARIYTRIWSDPDFRNLNRDAQRLYLLLVSQSKLTYCGSLDYIPARLVSLAEDEDDESLQSAMNTLEGARFVVTDYAMSELLVRSFVRHDGLLGSPNMTKAMLKDRSSMLSDRLRAVVDCELKRAFQDDPKLKGWVGFKQAEPDLFRDVSAKGSAKGSQKGSDK
jgi:hypothetical protein